MLEPECIVVKGLDAAKPLMMQHWMIRLLPEFQSVPILAAVRRKSMRVGVSVSAMVTCAILCGETAESQTQVSGHTADHVSQLADEKIEVSKLDWIMLTARVRMLEQIAAHESSRTVSSVGMRYDAEKKRVVVKGFVDPDWIENAKMDDAKKALLKAATSYCIDGLMLAEAEKGEIVAAASSNLKSDCAVHFFTWITKNGELTTKDIATFENGQLVLK